MLRACLASPHVREVRAIVRRPLDIEHERLRVFIHGDFLDHGAVEEAFAGVDACRFCLGISVRQVSGEAEYRTITQEVFACNASAIALYESLGFRREGFQAPRPQARRTLRRRRAAGAARG